MMDQNTARAIVGQYRDSLRLITPDSPLEQALDAVLLAAAPQAQAPAQQAPMPTQQQQAQAPMPTQQQQAQAPMPTQQQQAQAPMQQAQAPAPTQQPMAQPSQQFPDFNTLQHAAAQLGRSIGTMDPIRALFPQFGVNKLSELNPVQYDTFYAMAQQVVHNYASSQAMQ